MGGEGVQAQSGVGVGVEAAADEMLQLGAQDRGLAPVGQTQQDLGVRLKGDVSTHLAKIKLAKMIRKGKMIFVLTMSCRRMPRLQTVRPSAV